MPSIFRTPRKEKQLPTPQKPASFTVPSRDKAGGSYSPRPEALQEFGLLQSLPRNPHVAQGHHANGRLTPPQSPLATASAPPIPPKYSFAPTRIPTSTSSTSNSIDSFSYSHDEHISRREYGFLGRVGGRVTLGLEDVGNVIRDVGRELLRRGLTIPMLFSNQALELSSTRTKLLIQSYLDAIRSHQPHRYAAWQKDLNFAKEHELAWMLRWALSRFVRIREGTREVLHGLIEWDVYEEWRGRERAAGYPIDAFPFLAALVPTHVYDHVLQPLFSLLSRFAAHSHLSGLTPHALSSLFAPFLFDIPTTSPCMVAHAAFVRAAYATEHFLLSYIRSTSQGEGLGVTDLPGRLKEWVKGYPKMVASDADLARAQPRKGARTVRCERISRTVRAYSKDLISSSESWRKDVGSWEAWDRVVLRSKRGEGSRPKFSASWRRKLGVKESLPVPTGSDTSSVSSYGQAKRPSMIEKKDTATRRTVADEEDARWGSLAGKAWSLFEEGGFDSPDLGERNERDMRARLQFDLTESAKMSVTQKRQTMDWTEFASPSGGFNRTDPVLDVSLSFSSPLSVFITDWPKERDDLNRRLQKTQKDAIPFHYDTTPRTGGEVQDNTVKADQHGRIFVEEAFVDCWADWMMGGAWVDRDQLTFKEANWALIEYKGKPTRQEESLAIDSRADPRTSELFFLFEERVPLEYQLAVADPKEKKTLATFFSTNKKKRANASPTKARIGAGWEDSDFDRMLLHREKTKKLTVSRSEPAHASIWQSNHDSPLSPIRTSVINTPSSLPRSRIHSDEHQALDLEGKSFFSRGKEKVVRRVKTDEANREKAKVQREREVDFELRSASGISSPDTSPKDAGPVVHKNRKGEEKWMDILIANGAKRMDRQDANPPGPRQHPVAATGLPVSPHPPAPPAEQVTPPMPTAAVPEDPFPPYSDLAPLDHGKHSSGEYTHSPETSGSTDGQEIMTPRQDGADVQRWPSTGKRKPVPVIPVTPSPTQSPRVSREYPHRLSSEEAPVPPLKDRSLSPVIHAPRPHRDTIHNIVDTYRDPDSPDDESELAYNRESTYSDVPDPESDQAAAISSAPIALGAEIPSVKQRATAWEDKLKRPEVQEDTLIAPTPVFDLTPGREPSPARYKHGEPLQFVGEVDEEEEY